MSEHEVKLRAMMYGNHGRMALLDAALREAREEGARLALASATSLVRGFRYRDGDWRKGRQLVNGGHADRDSAIADAIAALSPSTIARGGKP